MTYEMRREYNTGNRNAAPIIGTHYRFCRDNPMEEAKDSMGQRSHQSNGKGYFDIYQNGWPEHNRNRYFSWIMGNFMDYAEDAFRAYSIWNCFCYFNGPLL